MKIFAAPKKIEKFSVRNASKKATQTARRVAPVLSRPCGDLPECCGGRAPSGRADCRAISHDFGRKFLRHRKNLKNFRSETRRKKRHNPHAAPCQCSADLVGTCRSAAEVGRRPAALIFARSRTISDEKFCGTEKNRNFSVPNAETVF